MYHNWRRIVLSLKIPENMGKRGKDKEGKRRRSKRLRPFLTRHLNTLLLHATLHSSFPVKPGRHGVDIQFCNVLELCIYQHVAFLRKTYI